MHLYKLKRIDLAEYRSIISERKVAWRAFVFGCRRSVGIESSTLLYDTGSGSRRGRGY